MNYSSDDDGGMQITGGHGDHSEDGDDHDDMVCHDMNTHTVDSTIATEVECPAVLSVNEEK